MEARSGDAQIHERPESKKSGCETYHNRREIRIESALLRRVPIERILELIAEVCKDMKMRRGVYTSDT